MRRVFVGVIPSGATPFTCRGSRLRCEAALRANPHNLVARVELGRAYVGMGALGKARAAFEEAVGDAARYPVEDVNDALYRQMAIDDIDRMRRGVPLGSLARPWWAL